MAIPGVVEDHRVMALHRECYDDFAATLAQIPGACIIEDQE